MYKPLKCGKCKQRTMNAHSSRGDIVNWECDKCGHKMERKMTKEQKLIHWKDWHPTLRTNIHRVWHEFERKFMKSIRGNKATKIGRKQFYFYTKEWRWVGYELMVKVGEWAKRYPNDVTVVRCDDDCYAGSDLVLIQHRKWSTGEYHGTTVLYVPQCTGEKPIRLFLYPHHHDALIEALKKIKARNLKKWDTL